ncbi:MAG: hypothetical protein Q9208_006608 [Pyrenodesmia sp. 3 TL-2023]
MHFSYFMLAAAALLASSVLAAPAATLDERAVPPARCYTLNFDDLPAVGTNKNGQLVATDLPANYKNFSFAVGQWGYAQPGTVYTRSSYNSDLDPAKLPWNVISPFTVKSGGRAIVSYHETGTVDTGTLIMNSSYQWFDLKSFYVRGEYANGFTLRTKCLRNNMAYTPVVQMTNVPAGTAYYKVTLPTTFENVRRCFVGTEGQQILMDDISVCTYDRREAN